MRHFTRVHIRTLKLQHIGTPRLELQFLYSIANGRAMQTTSRTSVGRASKKAKRAELARVALNSV